MYMYILENLYAKLMLKCQLKWKSQFKFCLEIDKLFNDDTNTLKYNEKNYCILIAAT